jgi:hypothetical protein
MSIVNSVFSGDLPVYPRVVPPPTVTITMTPASVIEGAVLAFVATGVSSVALTYQWNLNAVAIAGATLATYDRTTVLADNAGVITCTVTDTEAQATTSAGQTMVVALPEVVQAYQMTVGAYSVTAEGYSDVAIGIAYGSMNTTVHTPYQLMEISATGSIFRLAYNSGVSPTVGYFSKLRFTTSTGVVTEIPGAGWTPLKVGGIWGALSYSGNYMGKLGAVGTVCLVEFVMP